MGFIADHPGFLFVVATFLPLASFVLLLLAGGLRWAARSCGGSGASAALYRGLGGDIPSRWPAFVATGAIGLAFVVCLAGSLIHYRDGHHRHELEEVVHAKEAELHKL